MNSLFLVILLASPCFVMSIAEKGRWEQKLEKNTLFHVTKSAFEHTGFHVTIQCSGTTSMKMYWMLRLSPCADEYVLLDEEQLATYWKNGDRISLNGKYNSTQILNSTSIVRCDDIPHPVEEYDPKPTEVAIKENSTSTYGEVYLTKAPVPGFYLFVYKLMCVNESSDCEMKNATALIEIKSSYGYLSALEYPFLPFYGVMCGVYLVFALTWLVFSALFWKDMLRVQFWIAAVIVLGLLEKAFFYAEYESINLTGSSVRGAAVFAEFVSCVKRTLARVLLMVVCVGYGIVLPRLGEVLIKVVVLGVLYLIFAIVEGVSRQLRPRFARTQSELWFTVPLAITDATIFILTYSYLLQTIQNLRVRRNVVKFNLYHHFSNILVVVVIIAVIFMVWVLVDHKLYPCIKRWQEIWLDEAFWHILFSLLLLSIIWLWRPSRNNIRYAYSPILDADRDPESSDEEVVMDHMTSGELSRINQHNKTDHNSKKVNTPEDDLKWIEENIPASVAEHALPILNSEEELTAAKLAGSKMD